MTAISTKELTKMRAIADDFLPDTCTIATQTQTVDALGGVSISYANTYTLVKCRLDPIGESGSERISAAEFAAGSQWMLNIPYDQAITVKDQITHSSKTYEVVRVWDTHSYSTIRRASLKRID